MNYFGIKTDRDLFAEIQSAMVEFRNNPNDRLIFFLVFGLNHLREWIANASYEQINDKKKKGLSLTDEEMFFFEIWSLPEFEVINSLCNRSKHYSSKRNEYNTSVVQGARSGIAKCGDSLAQMYYLIDGKDSREVLNPIIKKYADWFEKVNQ